PGPLRGDRLLRGRAADLRHPRGLPRARGPGRAALPHRLHRHGGDVEHVGGQGRRRDRHHRRAAGGRQRRARRPSSARRHRHHHAVHPAQGVDGGPGGGRVTCPDLRRREPAVIPATFEHTAPTTIEEVVRALGDGSDETQLLAGGQSLLPVLKLRMADPDLLVDLGRVAGLREIREDGDDLVIGAMATHPAVAAEPLVAEHAGVLAQAAASVADPQIRYRGTIGGSLAHADPAGDIAPAVLALEASLELTGPAGTRRVAAGDFFEDYFTTALAEGEVLTAVRVPKHTGWGMHYEKFSQVAQSWAIV